MAIEEYPMPMSSGLQQAIKAAGGLRALGRKLGISYQSIQQWERVPAGRIIEIERVTGIDREKLRPDLYRVPHGRARRG